MQAFFVARARGPTGASQRVTCKLGGEAYEYGVLNGETFQVQDGRETTLEKHFTLARRR